MPFKHLTYSTLALAITSTFSAYANDDADKTIETIEVRGSYVEGYGAHNASGASKLDLAIVDIPQSVSVITATQIDDYQLNGINAVLDTATGINVERIETDRTYYNARGFDINNFQVDGIGLPLIRGNNHGDQDTAIYDRIEIIRGANGLMTGVGNPSATINFIRKRPGMNNELTAQATVGSWDNRRLELDGTVRINDQLGVRAVGVTQSSDSYLDRYGQEKDVLYVFADYQISDRTQVSLSHTLNDNRATGNNWGANPLFYTDGTATNYGRSVNTSSDWAYWNVKAQNTVAEFSHVFTNNWYVRATLSHKTTDEDSELFYVYGTPDSATELGLFGYASEYDHNETTDLIDVYLTGNFNFLGREHEFVVGINQADMTFEDISVYDYTTGNGFPVMPPLNTWDGNAALPTFADGLTGADVDSSQSALYFAARLNVLDSLHVTVGGRQNDWQVKGDSYGVAQDAGDDEFIPYIGAVYSLNEEVSAYASYTETFLSQTERDVNEQPLAPITGESQEIGLKSQWFDDKLIATVAYFDILQTNLATPDPATANLAPNMQRFIAADGISSNGVEIDIAGELMPGLQTSIGFTDFNISGNKLVADYTPKRIAKLAATYRPEQADKWAFGVNVRWQDAIARDQGVVAEGFANAGDVIVTNQDAYAIVDLMVRYQINNAVTLTINGNNVTNEKYINSLYWAQGYYGAPANVSATVTWSL